MLDFHLNNAFALSMTPVTFSLSGYIATGMRITLAVAAFLIVVALAIVVGSRAFATRNLRVEDVS